jgi:hypothetical protein
MADTEKVENVVLGGDEPGKYVGWELERIAERFPIRGLAFAPWPREVVIWCSNSYLRMGEHLTNGRLDVRPVRRA